MPLEPYDQVPAPHGEREERVARRVQRRWWVFSALGVIGVALLLGVVVTVRGGGLVRLDESFMAGLVDRRGPLWDGPALFFDTFGAGVVGVFVVPLVVAALLLLHRRPWGALYWVLASAVSAGVVQVLKNVLGRSRPDDILVSADFGSFPSGHTANAATIAVVLGVLLRRTWVWVLGALYVVAMLLSRTYLGAHWLTDTIGGTLVGVGVSVVLLAPFAHRVLRERGAPWIWRSPDRGSQAGVSAR